MTDPGDFTPLERGRRSPPDDVWARVRDDYLAGLSAPSCCRRHGVGLTTLRARARAEGWRRADQLWDPSLRDPCDEGAILEESVDGNLDALELFQLSFVAHRRMVRAILRGDGADALRWSRVQRAVDDYDREIDRELAQESTIARALARPRVPKAATAPTAPTASDGVLAPEAPPLDADLP